MLCRVLLVFSMLVLSVPSTMASSFAGKFVDRVIAAESGGNPQARPSDPKTGKPLSSAFGAGQFIAATWLEMVRKYRPDLASKSDDEILEMRGDYALSREMTVRYAEENRMSLVRAGLQPTNAAMYLAHFVGPRGTINLLKADRDTSVEDILSRKAIEANGFLVGQTVAMLYAWAKAKMNFAVVPASSRVVSASSEEVARRDSSDEPGTRTAELSPGGVRFIRGGVVEVAETN